MNDALENESLEDGLYEHHSIVVDKGQALLRIDKFLVERLDVSRSKIQHAADTGSIRVNASPVKPNYKVKPGDQISIVLPYPKREFELIPENIPLQIVYEDDALAIINKPANMVVHPGHGNYSGTLVNALLFHFNNLREMVQDRAEEGAIRPGLVHRIDKDTTGLMVIAKTDQAMSHLARQFFDHTIERRYVALVWGNLDQDEGTITGNIGRSVRDRKIFQVYEEPEIGKHAVTHYKVLERFGYVTLVECKLETGRTHQIRVHFKHIGHTLFGDVFYEGNKMLKGTSFGRYKQFIENCLTLLPRQALHARSLGFEHPVSGEWLHFESDLADDLQLVIEKWRNYTSAYRDQTSA